MNMLKKFFPLSFKPKKDVADLIIGILVYIVVGIIAGVIIALSGKIAGIIPLLGTLVGWLLGILGSLIELYILTGIVLKVLVFMDVLKD